MTDQIARMTARLALRRTALQKEFTAADAAMSQLKAQGSSLTSFSASLTSSR
jgi:flagellar capping protein FliD